MTHFVVDEKGNRTAVLMDIEEYNRLIEELEDADDVRAFDAAMQDKEPPVPLEQVLRDIGLSRKK